MESKTRAAMVVTEKDERTREGFDGRNVQQCLGLEAQMLT